MDMVIVVDIIIVVDMVIGMEFWGLSFGQPAGVGGWRARIIDCMTYGWQYMGILRIFILSTLFPSFILFVLSFCIIQGHMIHHLADHPRG